jgi:hypothetical protein
MAPVQGHAIVQNEKLHEIDRLPPEAMTGPRPTRVRTTLRRDGLNTAWRLAITEAETRSGCAYPKPVEPEERP